MSRKICPNHSSRDGADVFHCLRLAVDRGGKTGRVPFSREKRPNSPGMSLCTHAFIANQPGGIEDDQHGTYVVKQGRQPWA